MYKKLFTLGIILGSTYSVTHAQTPFPEGVTVGISKPGINSAAKNYTIYTTTTPQNGSYTSGTTFTPAHDLNGIGLDSIDHFAYASSYTGDNNTANLVNGVSLFRIGANGVNVNLGYLPMTGQTSIEFASFSAGTVSANDAYYYLTMGLKQSGVAKLFAASAGTPLNLDTSDVRIFMCWKDNISTLTANPDASMSGGLSGYYEVDFSNPDLKLAMQAFLNDMNAQFPNVYNAHGGIQDIAINPKDYKIYGYFSYPTSSTTIAGRPIVFNIPLSGFVVASPVGSTINNTPNQEIDGIAFDTSGAMHGIFTTGDYATINLTTGALSGLTPSNFTTSTGNLRGDLGSVSGKAYPPVTLANKLIKFEGSNNGNSNILLWETATENNNKQFIIERSEDQKQWVELKVLNSKAPNGNSNSNLSYTFTDARYNNTINYYRLILKDKSGEKIYSKVIYINNLKDIFTITAFPNPASQYLHISGTDQNQTILLVNMKGNIVYKTTGKTKETTLNVEKLVSGIYQLIIADSSNKVISKQKITIRQ